MTTTNASGPPASCERIRRVLELEVSGASDVLARVVLTLHRRNCRIVRLQYAAAGTAGTVIVEADVPAAHAHCVERWLENLVDVIAAS